ncbi:hypothetical protein [Streptomyces sp. NPDC002491]
MWIWKVRRLAVGVRRCRGGRIDVSGSGKTTLVRAMVGLRAVTGGTILLDGARSAAAYAVTTGNRGAGSNS